MGESTFHVQAEFEPSPGEGLYGLGAHQNGWMSYAGRDVDLYQLNTVDIVPFLASSRGYGLLWDNTSHTKFGDTREPVHVPAASLYDAEGQPGGLTGTYRQGDCATGRVVATRKDGPIAFGAPEDRPAISAIHNAVQATSQAIHPKLGPGPVCVVWEGELESGPAGDYDLTTFSNNGVRLSLDGKALLDTWRQGWLPWWDSFRLAWGRQRHRLRLEWQKEDGDTTLRLKWKTPPRTPYTSLWSEVGDGIDYYFVYGPELDDVIAGYRELTGRAPLMPRWALGLWQSRERYKTAAGEPGHARGVPASPHPDRHHRAGLALLEGRPVGLAGVRRGPIPRSRRLDQGHPRAPSRAAHDLRLAQVLHDHRELPDPEGEGLPLPRDPQAADDRLAEPRPHLLRRLRAEARELFWDQIRTACSATAWTPGGWMRRSPSWWAKARRARSRRRCTRRRWAPGRAWPTRTCWPASQAVYEGQRQTDPDQRVFMLTRSAFAGSQRYAAATWSGDVSSDWSSLARQIPAGLNLSLSGIPWWTTDIGGFSVPQKWSGPKPKAADVEEWRELVTRWFQFGTFCPLTRVHGQFPNREMWFFGDESHRAYKTQLAFDRLRYRMLPYNYTLAADVTRRHRTILRPLVMDFGADPRTLDIADQYLYGPALLVSPVTRPGATQRPVYLPGGADWYDFWTGTHLSGGQAIDAPAPFESIPLHVRAGSILPMGPELQYTGELPADPLTVWVYTGRDAAFELYEDDGVSYAHEKGVFATIPLRYDEATGTLTIGRRTGAYPGMPGTRTLRVVFVSKDRAVGHQPSPAAARELRYDGSERTVSLRP